MTIENHYQKINSLINCLNSLAEELDQTGEYPPEITREVRDGIDELITHIIGVDAGNIQREYLENMEHEKSKFRIKLGTATETEIKR